MPTLTIHTRYFTEDDVYEGDINQPYEAPEVLNCDSTEDAVEQLTERGLCGRYALSSHPTPDVLSGHEWLSLPDGSELADTWDANYTGLRMERSAHLSGWTHEDFTTIIKTVTKD